MTNEELSIYKQTLANIKNEDEFIIKPFQSGPPNESSVIERGQIVSRINRPIFDYHIGNATTDSSWTSILSRRICITKANTNQVLFDYFESLLPLIFQACVYKQVRWISSKDPSANQTIGTIRSGLAFGKILYDVFDQHREQRASLMLRKSHLRDKIQHRVPEFEIFRGDTTNHLGKICLFSTDSEQSFYGQAAVVKVSNDIDPESKVMLLLAAIFLKVHLR